jgi:hypothetical protein
MGCACLGRPGRISLRGTGDGVHVSVQELFGCLTFKCFKHDAVAELRMTGDYSSVDDDRVGVEPEGGLDLSADGEGHHQFDVAAGTTEVGGGETHGDRVAFLVELYLDLDGVPRMVSAIVCRQGCGGGLGVGGIHGSALGLLTAALEWSSALSLGEFRRAFARGGVSAGLLRRVGVCLAVTGEDARRSIGYGVTPSSV